MKIVITGGFESKMLELGIVYPLEIQLSPEGPGIIDYKAIGHGFLEGIDVPISLIAEATGKTFKGLSEKLKSHYDIVSGVPYMYFYKEEVTFHG